MKIDIEKLLTDKISLTPEQRKIVSSIIYEVCKKTLELAAENAVIGAKKKSQFGKYRKWQNVKENEEVDLFHYEMQYFVDKQSILNILTQIYED